MMAKEIAPSIGVKHLSFEFPDGTCGLKNIVLDLPPGSRTLLIGGMSNLLTERLATLFNGID